jgi:hypothetical protein
MFSLSEIQIVFVKSVTSLSCCLSDVQLSFYRFSFVPVFRLLNLEHEVIHLVKIFRLQSKYWSQSIAAAVCEPF